MNLSLPALLLLGAMCPPCLAQEAGAQGEPDPQHQKQMEEEAAKASEAGDGAHSVHVAGGAKNANLVNVHVGCAPRRLTRGELGKVSLVVVLHAPAVITAGTGVGLELEPEQGPLRFGSFQVQPPSEGTLGTRFRGQPVYDNTVTIEVPVTVADDAPFGKTAVKGAIVSNLTHGGTGQALGELRHEFHGEIEVGRPLPAPGGIAATDAGGATLSTRVAAPAGSAAEGGEEAATPAAGASPRGRVAKAGDRPRRAFVATGRDGLSLEVVPPSDDRLDGGGTYAATVRVGVPAGARLMPAAAGTSLLRLAADGGVTVSADRPLADGASGAVEVPLTVSIPAGARGMYQMSAELSYRLAGGGDGGEAGEAEVLRASAMLAVGHDTVESSPSLFYIAGGGLALILLLVVLQAIKKK